MLTGQTDALGDMITTVVAEEVAAIRDIVSRVPLRPISGEIVDIVSGIVRARIHSPRIGDTCIIEETEGSRERIAEIIGIEDGITVLAPLSDIAGLEASVRIRSTNAPLEIGVGDALLGRVLDALGKPNSQEEPLQGLQQVSIRGAPLDAMQRQLASEPFETGIRAIDGLLAMAKGQRMGIVGPAGCGKSTLMATILTQAQFDTAVIAMIGERGREVREFVEKLLPAEDRERCAFVASTSDESASVRALAAETAVRIAEYFADDGKDVLLMFDSLTRFARAKRDIGLAIGEMPTRRGFTPQSLAAMARLIERTGTRPHGSITAFFTVLTEGDEDDDPVREEALSLLDGHIELSPKLARAGHFPAIDVLRSKSRLIDVAARMKAIRTADKARDFLSRREEIDLMVQLGEYTPGVDAETDRVIGICHALNDFLKQPRTERNTRQEAQDRLRKIVDP